MTSEPTCSPNDETTPALSMCARYMIVIVVEITLTTALLFLPHHFPLNDFPIPYVLAIMLFAYYFGARPAWLAFVLGLLCFIYAFPPYHGIWPPATTPKAWAGLAAMFIGTAIVGIAMWAIRKGAIALSQSEYRYRVLIDTMNEGFATTDADYNLTYANLRFAEMLGRTPDEMTGHRLLEFVDESNHELMREQMKERRAGRYSRFELTFRAKDGHIVNTLVSPRPTFDRRGRFVGSFGVVTDITEMKTSEEAMRESERKYRQLFQNANDAIFLVSVDEEGRPGHFIDVNDVACKRLGYTREELLQLGPQDIDSRESVETLPERTRQTMVSRHGTYEVMQMAKDGRRLPVEINMHLFELEGKTVLLAIARDITERKRAEEERRAIEQQAEEQKHQFYRETILSVTEGKLDICEERDVRPYLERAEMSVGVPSAQMVSFARGTVEAFCQAHGLEGDRLSSFILGAGEAMTNAIKHGGQATVHAGTTPTTVWVGVEDHGAGIGSLILPHVLLVRGFSTKPSLGFGYSIMLSVADLIHLKTDDSGTTVILECNTEEARDKPPLEGLADTWEDTAT